MTNGAKFRRLPAVLLSFILIGCNSSGPSGSTSGGPKKLVVGVVFDSGGINDKSFNDSANAGLTRAVRELGVESKTISSKSEQDYASNIDQMASGGCNVVFAVGLSQEESLKEVAPRYLNVTFAIVDGTVDGPNVRSLHFNEEQGSFLAGYLAALTTKSHKIGFVGGEEIPLIKKFYVGYVAGAKTADPSIEVLPAKYVGNWDDTTSAKAIGQQLFGAGADIVYHAAGRSGLGVIAAANEANKYAIGVDSDQDDQAPGNVLTSMVKHVDNAVYQTIKDVKDGKFTAGTKVYDLASGGVGLSDMKFTKDKIGPANLAKVKAASDAIIAKKIIVPTTQETLDTYLKAIPKI
jgi:basic membrane protein A